MAKKENSFDLVSVSAIIIAVLSIIVSFWQASEERKHNRLSVKPNLEIIFQASRENIATYHISNNGLGPAQILKTRTFLDGKEMSGSGFYGLFQALDRLTLSKSVLTFDPVQKSNSILAGDKRVLIKLDLNNQNTDSISSIDLSTRLGFEVEYQSMYGEKSVASFLNITTIKK